MKIKKSKKSNIWQHLDNLTRRKIFYFAILLVIGTGAMIFHVRNGQAAANCEAYNGNTVRTFERITGPGPVMVGTTVTYTIRGCGMEQDDLFTFTNGTYSVSATPVEHGITDPVNGVNTATVLIDLSPLRDVGDYDMTLTDQLVSGGTLTYTKGGVLPAPGPTCLTCSTLAKKLNLYSSDVIGWGWFGASVAPGDDAAPGWLSLNCQTSGGDPANNCYNESSNAGVDFGLNWIWKSVARSELGGYAWFGTSQDDNGNPADNSVLGWIRFDEPAPYPSTDLPADEPCDLDGSTPACEPDNTQCAADQFCRLSDCTCQSNLGVADVAYVDTSSDQVLGWARSKTLQTYGQNLQCPSFKRDWNPREVLNSLIGTDLIPRIAVSSDGTMRAVWKEGLKIKYRQRVGGVWSGTDGVDITSAGINAAASPDIVVLGKEIHVAYINVQNGVMHYQYCLTTTDCTQASNWIGHYDINPTGASGSLRIAIAPNGLLMAFYYDDDAGQVKAYLKTNSTWTQLENPTPGTTPTSMPRVAADYHSNFHVAWFNDDDGQIYYNKYTTGGTSPHWDSPVKVSDPGYFNVFNPEIAVDPAAQPHIVFETDHYSGLNSNKYDVAYVHYAANMGWTAEEQVSFGYNQFKARLPMVAIGSDYVVHVSYHQKRASNSGESILHREKTNGQSWAGTNIDTTGLDGGNSGATITNSQLVVDQSNLVHVAGKMSGRSYVSDSQAQTCTVPQTDPNWGWLSLRGGAADPALGGSGIGSCYDCTDDEFGKSCRICETDVALYPAPNDNPPIYACNMCTKCGRCTGDGPDFINYCSSDSDCALIDKGTCEMRRACRLTGIDCTNLGSFCQYDHSHSCTTDADCSPNLGTCDDVSCGGGSNDCLPVCKSCATCNQWGVSMETLPQHRGQFHGYAWSAGGDITLDPAQLRPGAYDSGAIETEASITIGNTCLTKLGCQTENWLASDGSDAQYCVNDATAGSCRVDSTTPIWYSIPTAAIPSLSGLTDGYYYISFQGQYTNSPTPEKASIVINGSNGRIDQLNAADLSNVGDEMKECTFYRQVYLEKNKSVFKFQSLEGALPIDNFRITSLPISRTNCETGDDYSAPFSTYSNDVGFGWVDFSNVSMITPWTQTQFGDVYSLKNIGTTGGVAPAGRYNATFILETGPGMLNTIVWKSQASQSSSEYVRAGKGASIFLPKPSSGYANFMGRIDYAGLTEKTSGNGTVAIPGQNRYSKRVIDTFNGDTCDDDNTILWSNIKDQVLTDGVLNGGIYHIGSSNKYCKLVIDVTGGDVVFNNGDGINTATKSGSGLFIIEGDLEVNKNITYGTSGVETTNQLASVGWIVKGNVVVAGDVAGDPVSEMVGAYIVVGCEDVEGYCNGTVGNNFMAADHDGKFSTGSASSPTLYVYGLAMAKSFDFQRRVGSSEVGSEVFVSNGRERANTPPGMASITEALPRDITSVAPQ